MSVTSVRNIGMFAEDTEALASFYQDLFGLQVVSQRGSRVFLRGTGPDSYILGLYPGPRRRIHHIGMGAASRAEVDALALRLTQAGVRLTSGPAELLDEPGGGYGLRIVDPDGRLIEIVADAGSAGAADWSAVVRPTKISHVVLNSAAMEDNVRFYTELLGFRISDRTEQQMVFLRCGIDHHNLALNRAPHASINHVAYEVPSVQAVLDGRDHLIEHGFPMIWGTGRHGPGNNVFAYFQDPNGQVMEYTAEILQIHDEADYPPRVWRMGSFVRGEDWDTAQSASPSARAAMLGDPDPGIESLSLRS